MLHCRKTGTMRPTIKPSCYKISWIWLPIHLEGERQPCIWIPLVLRFGAGDGGFFNDGCV